MLFSCLPNLALMKNVSPLLYLRASRMHLAKSFAVYTLALIHFVNERRCEETLMLLKFINMVYFCNMFMVRREK